MTATCGSSSKTIQIEVIKPGIASMEFTSATNAPHYQIYSSGSPMYCGWETSPSTYSNPGCFKQGKKSAVKVEFWHSTPLTFATQLWIRGDVNYWDEYIVGGDYSETSMTFGTSWRSPNPAAIIVSQDTVDQEIDYDKDVDITWYYKVTWGTNEWTDAGETNDLTYYRIYDSPKYGVVPRTFGGNFQQQDFTVYHIDYATDLAEAADEPVTPGGIASEIVDERGNIDIDQNMGEHTHDNVNTMWEYFKTGDSGQCGCFASGMAYVLRCLGIDSNVAYANLNLAINSTADSSGEAECTTCTRDYVYLGERWWVCNNWQGVCYITAAGANTVCYDPQHELVNKYWELGNDEDGGTSGNGVLYDYIWVESSTGGQVQSGSTTGVCGHTLTITTTPNYNGN